MDLVSSAPRILFFAAIILAALSTVEWVMRSFDYTIVGERFTPGRLLELGVVAVIFVVALLLRQIRDELRKTSS